VTNLMAGMDQVIVGQKHLVESLLIGLLADGHILLEGVPGLAKTLAIKTLASLIDSKYSRIQFTPDLLPADVLGTMIYSQRDEQFVTNKGPIFANLFLLMKLTVLLRKYRVLCWKLCRNVRLH
jgi:MoxR-like ATPase